MLLAQAGRPAIFSYAGRTAAPVGQPLPMRIGGFGGASGLTHYLRAQDVAGLVDATHPFADRISRNADAACRAAGVPMLMLRRPEWPLRPGWRRVPDIAGAVAALPRDPTGVFLAIGRQNLAAFAGLPHAWLLRLVDAPEAPPLPGARVVVARGPFDPAGDLALMRAHGITHLVAKNSGGTGAAAKLEAARALGVQVVLIDRPAAPDRPQTATPEDALDWLHQTVPWRGV